MGINQDITRLVQDATVELFTVDLNTIGVNEIHRFVKELDKDGQKIVFEGHEYDPWALQVTGFEKVGNGAQPRPNMVLGDPGGVISALARRHQDLVGAKVTRKRTKEKYLDNRPTGDSTQQLKPDVYFVAKKAESGGAAVTFELGSPLDLQGVRIPNRSVTQSGCRWDYRGPDCGYTGDNYFNRKDEPVATLAEDQCGFKLSSCKKRFGEYQPLPFGAFPGSKLYV